MNVSMTGGNESKSSEEILVIDVEGFEMLVIGIFTMASEELAGLMAGG